MIYWYKLVFKTPVHVGERGIGVSSVSNCIHSTTIHSAIINALILLGRIGRSREEILGAARSFKVNTPTPLLSGNIPLLWIKGLDIIIGMNKSMDPKMFNSIKEYDEILRSLKRIRLAQYSFFEEDISKCSIDYSAQKEYVSIVCGNRKYKVIELFMVDRYIGILVDEKTNIDTEIVAQREIRIKNVIDRITSAAHLYHLAIITFYEPLILGVEISSEQILSVNDIEAALRLLGEIGIGGKRTYGFGEFAFSRTNVGLPRIDSPMRVVQGLYAPRMSCAKHVFEGSLYSVKIHGSRSGYTGILRSPITVIEEGSILLSRKPCEGLIVVDNEYFAEIIRSFDPISIPIKPIMYS